MALSLKLCPLHRMKYVGLTSFCHMRESMTEMILRGWPVRPERRGLWVRKARLLLTNLARCPPPRIWFNHCLPELHGPKSYTKVSTENLWGGLYSTVLSSVLVVLLTRWIQNWSGLGCSGFNSPDWSASTSSRELAWLSDSTAELEFMLRIGYLA